VQVRSENLKISVTGPNCDQGRDNRQNGNNGHIAEPPGSLRWHRSEHLAVRYEPGTSECRVLINSKDQIETMLLTLSKMENTEAIREQLRSVHAQLEALHDQVREQRSSVPA